MFTLIRNITPGYSYEKAKALYGVLQSCDKTLESYSYGEELFFSEIRSAARKRVCKDHPEIRKERERHGGLSKTTEGKVKKMIIYHTCPK
jgi:hypothetical protein